MLELTGAVLLVLFLRPLWALMRSACRSDRNPLLLGLPGVVRSGEVTAEFGQVEVVVDGAHVLVHARAAGGESFRRGEPVVLVQHDPERDTYEITGA